MKYKNDLNKMLENVDNEQKIQNDGVVQVKLQSKSFQHPTHFTL